MLLTSASSTSASWQTKTRGTLPEHVEPGLTAAGQKGADAMENLQIGIRLEQGVTVVELLDREIPQYDEQAGNEIAQALFSRALQMTPVKMVLDFTRVSYVGSVMLGTLIRLSKRIQETGGALKLCGIPPMLSEMFVITKLDTLFDIHPEQQAAISSFGAG